MRGARICESEIIVIRSFWPVILWRRCCKTKFLENASKDLQNRGSFGGILSAIKNAVNDHRAIGIHLIVNSVGKAIRQQAMEPKHFRMNSAVKRKGIYIREKGIKKITAYALCLLLIELAPSGQV